MEIKTYLDEQKHIVEQALARYMLQAEGDFTAHIDSMRYSLFAGGKRLRPILCLAAARMIAGDDVQEDFILPIACALECIHTYSLIHDDLPAMDDDSLRRGKQTNHVMFGEAEAILAGDGLQCFAFELLSNPDYNFGRTEERLNVIFILAQAAGPLGMVGGQSLDVASEGKNISYPTLQSIHRSKTGALITAAVLAGGLAAGASAKQQARLKEYGNSIGLAFQIVDDILNVESTPEQLGKAAGSDAQRGKATYPALFGLEKSRTMAQEAVNKAIQALNEFGTEAKPLQSLAQYIINRKK